MATNGSQLPPDDLEPLAKAIHVQAYGIDLTGEKAQKFQQGLVTLWSDTSRETVAPIWGDVFLDVVKAAPAEFALTTMLAHVFLTLPTVLKETALEHDRDRARIPQFDELEAAFKRLLTTLAAAFAAANQHECEYSAMKATSWHEIAFTYGSRAYRVLRSGLDCGYQEGVKEAKRIGVMRALKKTFGHVPERRRRDASEAQVRDLVGRINGYGTALDELTRQGLAMSLAELKGLAIRMQQELPRAWAFVYGAGNTGFQKLDDAVFAAIESCVDPSRACAPRDAYFCRRNREGLGPVKIAREWNAKSQAERQQIAPRASGRVTWTAVKKAIRRFKGASSRAGR